MIRRLLIDDTRLVSDIVDLIPSTICAEDTMYVARTFGEGISVLQECAWDELYLDHDLGGDGNGYDIMLWLESRPEFLPRKIILVTANPLGARRMFAVIKRLRNKGMLA